MIAVGYVGVAYLIRAVKRELLRKFVDDAGVYVTDRGVAGVPLGSNRKVWRELLFEGELALQHD